MNDKTENQNNQLSAKLQAKGAAPAAPSFKAHAKEWFSNNQHALAALMGSEGEAKRIYLAALNVVSKNKTLLDCSPSSVFQALMQCAELKLYPGPLNEAAIVPFWNSSKKCFEATFMPQYQGLIKLAMNSGHLVDIETNVVCEGDHFFYEFGSKKVLEFRRTLGERGKMIAAYALVTLRSGGKMFEVMSAEDIFKIRARSKTWQKDQEKRTTKSIWSQEDIEHWMWRKTVLKQLLKLIPKSIELAQAIQSDDLEGEEESKPLIDLASGMDVSAVEEEG